jgi:hypothetical protein
VNYPRGGLHPIHNVSIKTLSGNARGEDPKSVGVHHFLWLPRAGASINIPPRGILFMDLNMDEGPFCQIKGRQSWEEELYCKRLEIGIETICPYSPAQTIGALYDHSGPWDMDHLQEATQCEFQIFKLLD